MGKNPAFQFYPSDWLNDVELQQASPLSRGIWINALCRMWHAQDRGEIKGTKEQISMLCNCNIAELDRFISEAETLGFCYTKHDSNGGLTLQNRRMKKEHKDRLNNRLRQKKHYEKHKEDSKPNANITRPSSSSSSSSSSKDKYIEEKKAFDKARKLYPGRKYGLEVEFENFVKNHKDWKDALPQLKPAIEAQTENHNQMKKLSVIDKNIFVPSWKNFKTWINNACWTQEPEVIDYSKYDRMELLMNDIIAI